MRVRQFTVIIAILLIGCADREQKILGQPFDGVPVSVLTIKQTSVNSRAVLRGTMTQKCPVAGCWFMLRDETGTIKVDTKNAGFVVVEVPMNASVTVTGQVVTNGAERFIDATGVRY